MFVHYLISFLLFAKRVSVVAAKEIKNEYAVNMAFTSGVNHEVVYSGFQQ